MDNWPVLALIIGIAILVMLVAMIAIYMKSKNRDKQAETDYRAFFILGISFLPIGIATDNPGLWVMGAVFLILGLANRDKWKAEPKWSELGPEKRRNVFFIILGLVMLLAFGVVFFLLAKST